MMAVERLGALAQGIRLALFRCLVSAGPAGVAAGRIAAELGLPIPLLDYKSGTGEVLTSGKENLVSARITGLIHLAGPGT